MNLLLGDCTDQLKQIYDSSIDSLVTDPPAGISFMGKDWDHHKGGRKEWVAWMKSVMQECYRVMKPGAHGFVWALPRTSHWTATALEDAGFEIRDIVVHLFGSGFPKSLDVSNAIDKAAGAEWEVIGPDPYAKNHPNPRGSVVGQNYGNDLNPARDRTAPSTDAAKKWQGWGTALKPASEHWVLIRKPLSEKTVAANVLKWGTGGINIEASRIEFQSEAAKASATPGSFNFKEGQSTSMYSATTLAKFKDSWVKPQGRFPANLILSHTPYCTDDQCDIECAVKMLDEQSGHLLPTGNKKPSGTKGNSIFGIGLHEHEKSIDTKGGGASRFFYCAKASKSEKNAGLDDLDKKVFATSGGARAAASRGEKYDGNSGFDQISLRANHHPTVKSLKLMKYLITMITPPNGVVLDCFMGSGSTGVAAKALGFDFVGIEREADYYEIAKKRIE